MNYYKIQHSLDSKIVGQYGQIVEAKMPPDWETNLSFTENISFKKFSGKVITPTAILYKKAKLTDLLSTIPVGFTPKLLATTKLKHLFEEFGGDLFQFFPCDVNAGAIIYEYWLISPLRTHWEVVDFERTETRIRRSKPEGGTYLSVVPVESRQSFEKLISDTDPDERWNITVDKIQVFANTKLDIFVLDKVDGGVGYFVSERFKQAIEVNELTGIEFKPMDLNIHEWFNNVRPNIYGNV